MSAGSPTSHGLSMPARAGCQTPVQGVVKVQGIDHVWQLVDGQLMLEPPPKPPSTTPPPSPPPLYHNIGAASEKPATPAPAMARSANNCELDSAATPLCTRVPSKGAAVGELESITCGEC